MDYEWFMCTPPVKVPSVYLDSLFVNEWLCQYDALRGGGTLGILMKDISTPPVFLGKVWTLRNARDSDIHHDPC